MKRFPFAALVALGLASAVQGEPLAFHLTFTRAVSDKPFTGRIYVMLTGRDTTALPGGLSWVNPDPTFAIDVTDWKSGETRVVGEDTLSVPNPLSKLPKGVYTVFGVMDFNLGGRVFSTSEGNGYSAAKRMELDPAATGSVELVLDHVYHAPKFRETERVKLVEIESKLLTQFEGRPTTIRAAVRLPASFPSEPQRRYPVVYNIPGFGGGIGRGGEGQTKVGGVEMLHVTLDPSCRWGHSVFADSDNNGPVGRALTEELIPAIESKYRGIGTPGTRYLTGHSSGGWSSLWLQVAHPDFFGGAWSTSPDPVDFRDFQRINIYKPDNMFFEADGSLRPLSRGQRGRPGIFFKNFSAAEVVEGHGDQLTSFEAVFGPRLPNGRPRDLWNKKTGVIDPVTAKAWERYDIRLVLERDWPRLGPKLKGKLNIFTGSLDTFYLEGAVRLLKESLEKLGSDAVVEVVEGRHHGNLRDAELSQRIAREMAAAAKREGVNK